MNPPPLPFLAAADNIHFMYFRPPRRGSPEAANFKPPTTTSHLLAADWLAAAREVHAAASAEEAAQLNPAWALPAAQAQLLTSEQLNPPIAPGAAPMRPRRAGRPACARWPRS